jgi:hypothetical protein
MASMLGPFFIMDWFGQDKSLLFGVAIEFHPGQASCRGGRAPVPSTSIETTSRIFTDRALTPLLKGCRR